MTVRQFFIIIFLISCSRQSDEFSPPFKQNPSENSLFHLSRPIVFDRRNDQFDNSNKGSFTLAKCDHRGGSLTDMTVLFSGVNAVEAALKCSLDRCNNNDPVGCMDLAYLYSPTTAERMKKSEISSLQNAHKYYEKACLMNLGQGCFEYGQFLDTYKQGSSRDAYIKACQLNFVEACEKLGDQYRTDGLKEKAIESFKKSCGGVYKVLRPSILNVTDSLLLRFGCQQLAELAAEQGDQTSSLFFYKIQCDDGIPQVPNFPCAKAGIMLYSQKKLLEARTYLLRGCLNGIGTEEQSIGQACKFLKEIDKQGHGE